MKFINIKDYTLDAAMDWLLTTTIAWLVYYYVVCQPFNLPVLWWHHIFFIILAIRAVRKVGEAF